ncbi:MAG TPA: C-terminal helicase domain-containing protein, partial [Ramlibacter sp.]|nr:C-terminal helicase domain-containing protein [Ramlibacter sp.]
LAEALAYKVRYGEFEESGRAARELDMRLRQETGIAKAPFVAKYVRLLVEETGQPVVLFGWHRDVYDIWNAELQDLGTVMYTGTESPGQKAQAQARFLAGEAKVFIMSLRSGAGLDGLQHVASTCVFGELDWSPAMHDQCIGRLNREGQRCWPERVNAIFLVADDGADPPMMEVLGIKASQAHHIVDAGLGPQAVHSDRSTIDRLVARYLREESAA